MTEQLNINDKMHEDETTEEVAPQNAVEDVQDDTSDTVNANVAFTFPRSYVERLRDENARYRQRAQRADQLGERLHHELVARTGRLADAADLPYNDCHLDDPEALNAAIDGLLDAKPHLASRKPSGSIGQGVSVPGGSIDLAGLLRSRA